MKFLIILFLTLTGLNSYANCTQPSFCNRSCWSPTGNQPAQSNPSTTNVTHIIVHHTGEGIVLPANTDYKARMRFYWDLHVNTNGWADIGYNWLIDRNGIIYEGRGDGISGAHFSGNNGGTMGVCMIGDFTMESPSTAALNSLRDLIAWEAGDKNVNITASSFHASSGLTLNNLSGHQDGGSTACPGTSLYSQLPSLRTAISNLPCYNGVASVLDCQNAIALTCGVTFNGAASSVPSSISTYGCATSINSSGPERVHTITPTSSGSITATISNYLGNLDVYILGSCDPSDCLGSITFNSATYNNAVAGTTYYVVVDAADGSGSSYELTVTCPPSNNQNDITLTNNTLSSSTINTGGNVTASVTQNYSGNSTTNPQVDLHYYLSTDCNYDQSDLLLSSNDFSTLNSNTTSENESEVLTIPSGTASGNYFIVFVGDANNAITEGNENNNTICSPITITTSPGFNCGSAIPISCGVSYSGTSSSASSNISTYGCNGSNQSGPERIHSITPQSSGSLTAVVSNFTGDLDVFVLGSCDATDCQGIVFQDSVILANVIGGQTYYVVVDSDNGSGSAYDLIVKCTAQAGNNEDVTIDNASVTPTTINAGGIINATSAQAYSGNLYSTDINGVTMDYYLSTDCNYSNDDIYLGGSISQLGSNNPSSIESINLGIPSNITPGNYFIVFVGDNGQDVFENDETNNESCVSITINGSTGINDISLSNFTVNLDSVTAGESVDVSAVINYSGNQTSTNLSGVELNYYLSTDCNLSSDDAFLGDDIANIGSNNVSSTESESLVIPINTESGNYYILFVSDDNNSVSETNENNNLECIAIYVDGEFVSVNEADLLNNISLFPNPTKDRITINSENITIERIEVYNNLGVMLSDIRFDNSIIDLSKYTNGIYYVKLFDTEKNKSTFKVIKE